MVIHLLLLGYSFVLIPQMWLHYRICAVSRQISAVCRVYICVGRAVKAAQIGHAVHIGNESSHWKVFACQRETLWSMIILNWTSRAFFSRINLFRTCWLISKLALKHEITKIWQTYSRYFLYFLRLNIKIGQSINNSLSGLNILGCVITFSLGQLSII